MAHGRADHEDRLARKLACHNLLFFWAQGDYNRWDPDEICERGRGLMRDISDALNGRPVPKDNATRLNRFRRNLRILGYWEPSYIRRWVSRWRLFTPAYRSKTYQHLVERVLACKREISGRLLEYS